MNKDTEGIEKGTIKKAVEQVMKANKTFLKVKGKDIVDEEGKKVFLRGVNLGGWLMMEGYILGGRNIPETAFKNKLAKRFGKRAKDDFSYQFRKHFIQKEDIRIIKKIGFNVIRVPFNYRLIEDRPYHYSSQGVSYLDQVIKWAEEYGLYVILDLHAAPGSQNIDWHSDSNGEALLWESAAYQKRTIRLWAFLAQRYKEKAIIAGYDLLNEPVTENNKLLGFYGDVIKAIRSVDKRHILFLEGNLYSRNLDIFNPRWDNNSVYSIHSYQPINFTFNFVKGLCYPGVIDRKWWDKKELRRSLSPAREFQRKYNLPIYVGEFGINSRCAKCHFEYRWLKDILEIFKEYGFHWTYWTYKAVASGIYPDGIYQLQDNLKWLKRQEVTSGWERLYFLYKEERENFFKSLNTENFTELKELTSLLKKYLG